jgi:hypothetical protein
MRILDVIIVAAFFVNQFIAKIVFIDIQFIFPVGSLFDLLPPYVPQLAHLATNMIPVNCAGLNVSRRMIHYCFAVLAQ